MSGQEEFKQNFMEEVSQLEDMVSDQEAQRQHRLAEEQREAADAERLALEVDRTIEMGKDAARLLVASGTQPDLTIPGAMIEVHKGHPGAIRRRGTSVYGKRSDVWRAPLLIAAWRLPQCVVGTRVVSPESANDTYRTVGIMAQPRLVASAGLELDSKPYRVENSVAARRKHYAKLGMQPRGWSGAELLVSRSPEASERELRLNIALLLRKKGVI